MKRGGEASERDTVLWKRFRPSCLESWDNPACLVIALVLQVSVSSEEHYQLFGSPK